ncbi:hypothetical protein SAMN06265379_101945 [Saccharicrinis carchari]|uniref:Uncharacterized protein n=1 Tax=Saccharicrinis carchari TaxID=1168039 RepID=A0A521BHR5_SACCC|nr:hypothetical protein [Saccharicrinis carchari]SMO46623.1 hypothetical protein SAMN06265379_101945 [Saccharicrinis carchari]
MKKDIRKIFTLLLLVCPMFLFAQEKLDGVVHIDMANTTDNNSPGITVKLGDDFLYDGKYINHYGFGFHDYQDNSSSFNGRNAYTSGYFGIDYFTGGKNRLRINSNGYIGIGTLTPGSMLNVGTKTSNSPSTIVQFGKRVINGEAMVLSLVNSGGGSNQSSSIGFHNRDVWSPTGKIQVQQLGSDTKSKMHFHTYNSGLKTRMTIDENGFVGIGTTNPSEKLDIAGNLKTKRVALFDWYNTSLGYTNASIALNGIRQNGEWKLYGDGARSSIGLINMDIFSNIRFISHHDESFNGGKTMTDDELIKAYTKMIIKSNGHIGIGTDSPNHKLDVAGTVRAEEIIIEAKGQTADFVFEPDYQLRDLSEVETFIKDNKHLPDIPSASQMEEQGVNLAEMNKLLLQKVEELTLYAIEKDKEVKGVKADQKELEVEMQKMKDEFEAIKKLILNQ